MRGISLLALLLFILGASLLYYGMRLEGGAFYLFLIFPVFVLSGPLSILGALLLFLSVFLGFLSLFALPPVGVVEPPAVESPIPAQPPGREKRWGGIVLLGPIPLVFGSDVKITTAMLILGIVLTVALLFLFLW